MCRLLGVVSDRPVSVAEAVGEVVLKDFVALTKIHGDGWGVARVDPSGGAPNVVVSAASAVDDPEFATAAAQVSAPASIVHLRWATAGLAVRLDNSHPFVADGIAMAHNGSIRPIEPLAAMLAPEVIATLRGSTDSERYFALIRQHRRGAPNLIEAVRTAVSELRRVYPEASLNALVLGEGQLVAVHAHARTRLPDGDIEQLSAVDLPAEHVEDYFALRLARPNQHTVVIGSTGFGDLPWQLLPAESVTAVALADLSVTSLPLVAD